MGFYSLSDIYTTNIGSQETNIVVKENPCNNVYSYNIHKHDAH